VERRVVQLLSIALIALAGCAPVVYDTTPVGRFEGIINLRWLEPNIFLYLPDPAEPFRFIRANGQVIEPGPMLTDGGSIPASAWWLSRFTPWTYGPAYLLHDWIFRGYVCGYFPADTFSFEDSAEIMAEAMRTQMELDANAFSEAAFYVIISSVSGPAARLVFENNVCLPIPDELLNPP
jgi:hypothetical protein